MAMSYIVSYDISDDKRRRKISKYLGGWGNRIQESVFICKISNGDFTDFLNGFDDFINTKCDHVAIFRQCASCDKEMHILGEPFHVHEDVCYLAF